MHAGDSGRARCSYCNRAVPDRDVWIAPSGVVIICDSSCLVGPPATAASIESPSDPSSEVP